jgi:hypothetical protein
MFETGISGYFFLDQVDGKIVLNIGRKTASRGRYGMYRGGDQSQQAVVMGITVRSKRRRTPGAAGLSRRNGEIVSTSDH